MASVSLEEVKNGTTPYVQEEDFRKYVVRYMNRKGTRFINQDTLSEMYVKFKTGEKPKRFNMPEHLPLEYAEGKTSPRHDHDLFWVYELPVLDILDTTFETMVRKHGKEKIKRLLHHLMQYQKENHLVPLPPLKRFYAIAKLRGWM